MNDMEIVNALSTVTVAVMHGSVLDEAAGRMILQIKDAVEAYGRIDRALEEANEAHAGQEAPHLEFDEHDRAVLAAAEEYRTAESALLVTLIGYAQAAAVSPEGFGTPEEDNPVRKLFPL